VVRQEHAPLGEVAIQRAATRVDKLLPALRHRLQHGELSHPQQMRLFADVDALRVCVQDTCLSVTLAPLIKQGTSARGKKGHANKTAVRVGETWS